MALSAFVADLPAGKSRDELAAHQEALREILTKSFHASANDQKLGKEKQFAGGPYDSPTGFDPHNMQLKATLDFIRKNLESL